MNKKDKFQEVNRLIELALNIANYVDKEGEQNLWQPLCDYLHIGFGCISDYLRSGAKACIDLQGDYLRGRWQKKLAEDSEKEARDFLEECFGDREPECINDKDKARILEFCNKIYKEWEKEEKN